MTGRLARLGPGVMIAATAVGVSHLVQSTRAGATFGLSLSFAMILIVLLKYPSFRFAAEYASATGRSLVHGYLRLGRVATAWLVIAMLIELFIGASAVSLVSAGVLISVLNIPVQGPVVATGIVLLTAIVLANGSYVKAERILKAMVIIFSVLTLSATIAAVPKLGNGGREIFASLSPDWALVGFVVAMTGWMPLPVAVSAFHSAWVREKISSTKGAYSRAQAVFDLNVGWILTLVLALCFVIMGTAVLHDRNLDMPVSAAGFATMLFSVFTDLAGDWMYPVLAVGGIAVIWSTLIAIMDAAPRLMVRLWAELGQTKLSAKSMYRVILAVQVIGVTIVLSFFLQDFASFIDVAASTGFLVAPAMAYFNFRLLATDRVSESYVPGTWMVVWNWIAIGSFAGFAVLFIVIRAL